MFDVSKQDNPTNEVAEEENDDVTKFTKPTTSTQMMTRPKTNGDFSGVVIDTNEARVFLMRLNTPSPSQTCQWIHPHPMKPSMDPLQMIGNNQWIKRYIGMQHP